MEPTPIPADVRAVWDRCNAASALKSGEGFGQMFPWPPSWSDVHLLLLYINQLREEIRAVPR